jgi:hypothetical protein
MFFTGGAMRDYDVVAFIFPLAKLVTTAEGSRREPGQAGWFLPGGFSRKVGPIKHQLVLVC